MNYVRLDVRLMLQGRWDDSCAWVADLLKDALISMGFDAFTDTPEGFEAYCPDVLFSMEKVKAAYDEALGFVDGLQVVYGTETIEQRDWNAEWEKNYPSVVFDGFCVVRPPFNPKVEGVRYDVVIEPKMSFGTAHHQTTSLIIDFLSVEDMKGKRVMDMGCGTGVLAIISKMMGALYCEAVDNDTWAAENAAENVKRNGVDVKVRLGDSSLLQKDILFDVFIANINRNILLDNVGIYSANMAEGGVLFLSGFYTEDVDVLKSKCETSGLTLSEVRTRDNWVAMRLVKR